MGLNIKEIIPRKEIKISDLKGKVLCVDAHNILYQFLSSIRQLDGTPLMDKQKRIQFSHKSFKRFMSITRSVKLPLPPGIPLAFFERKFSMKKFLKQNFDL